MERESVDDQESPGVTLSEDLRNIEMTWNDFREVADDRSLWKSRISVSPLHVAGLRSTVQRARLTVRFKSEFKSHSTVSGS